MVITAGQIGFIIRPMDNNLDTRLGPATPQKAFDRLKEGNLRFISGLRSIESFASQTRMKELAEKGQKPFAIILTCSDSRSPVEIIFDQGIGDLFVVRVAGNVVAPSLLASIEFAAANFGSAVVLVLGHSLCGAIIAAVDYARNPSISLPSPNLEELLGRIRPAVDRTLIEYPIENPEFINLSTHENVRRSMRLIQDQSQIIKNLVTQGKLSVEGGVLDIATGQVNFIK